MRALRLSKLGAVRDVTLDTASLSLVRSRAVRDRPLPALDVLHLLLVLVAVLHAAVASLLWPLGREALVGVDLPEARKKREGSQSGG